MNFEIALIIGLSSLSTLLLLSVLGLRNNLKSVIEQRDRLVKTAEDALAAAARADEKMQDISNIHQELLKRPIQAVLSEQAALTMAREIAGYMGGGFEVPIRKGPMQ
jgi:hypothetical protein